MNRPPSFKANDVLRKLRRVGFEVDHVTGSHYILRHADGRRTVVPYHANHDIKRGLLQAILQQAELTMEEFLDL